MSRYDAPFYIVKVVNTNAKHGFNQIEAFFRSEDAEKFKTDWIKEMNEYGDKDHTSLIKVQGVWPS